MGICEMDEMARELGWVRVFAPASVGNVGPGFDALGLALEGLGDTVAARRTSGGEPRLRISSITGEARGIPHEPDDNCAGRAAASVLRRLSGEGGAMGGIEIRIHKGMPRGSGLGSSAASAVGGAVAANLLYGSDLDGNALMEAALDGEMVASSARHADNVAASLLGGLTIVKRHDPLEVIRLEAPQALRMVVVLPDMEIETHRARALIPARIPLSDAVCNWAHVAALVAAVARGNVAGMGRAVEDRVAEPARRGLIPGFDRVKGAALEAGAHGCSISGAGPSLFAVATAETSARVARAMRDAFREEGLEARYYICPPENRGARRID